MKPWRERVAEALARGTFTEGDREAAHDFRTCAVGEQCKAAPLVIRYELGTPIDDELYSLGYEFYWDAVRVHDAVAADRLLDQIEDRVLQLKREAVE